MPGINDLDPILHHIRVKLYPNYLPGGAGTFVARTDSDRTVNVKDICTIMVNRAGFDGDFQTLHDYVCQFLDEMAYQLCDGFTTNLTYFTIHPNVTRTFKSLSHAYNREENPVNFSYNTLAKLREMAKYIDVEILGLAEAAAYIDQFVDVEENSVNSTFVPGNGFAVHGHHIKIDGNNPACGVYFVPALSPGNKVKVNRILENTPSKVMGICPSTGYQDNYVEIVTQFTAGSSTLKEPRTIRSPFTLEEV